ncbi:MAG: hypothetical protein IJV33_02280 [Bacteroidaceae bacterium]|nr:hypothetical protein [Bacteroidaceae bacterium]
MRKIVIIFLGCLLVFSILRPLYYIAFKGYDRYGGYGVIESTDSIWKYKQIGLSQAEEAHRLKHKKGWSDERIKGWSEAKNGNCKKLDEGVVIFPLLYYPRKWRVEYWRKKYGDDRRVWPEEVLKEFKKPDLLQRLIW